MKNTIKKFGAVFAGLALALCLTACSNSGTSSSVSAPSPIQSGSTTSSASPSSNETVSASEGNSENLSETDETEQSKTELVSSDTNAPAESDPAEPQDGKTLVVYYSASGNTKAVAELIAEKTDSDLFEIVPKEPYTSADLNWTDRDSRVSREHDDESLRDIELENTVVPEWESYDTVFIGYPIWWYIAAWPVDGFVKANDFSDKTVIPFCTSSSSGLGDSGNLLASEAGSGNWTEGRRFSSRPKAM